MAGALAAVLALLGAAGAQRPVAVSGQIINPTGKDGTVVAWAGYINMSPSGVIAYGEVKVDGKFALELPGRVIGDVLRPIEVKNVCQTGGQDLKMQPGSTTHLLVNTVMAFDLTRTPVTAVLASSKAFLDRLAADKRDVEPGDALAYYLYVNDALSISGSCVNSDGFEVTYDVKAAQGWNLVLYSFEARGPDVVARFETVKRFPAGIDWVSLVGG